MVLRTGPRDLDIKDETSSYREIDFFVKEKALDFDLIFLIY